MFWRRKENNPPSGPTTTVAGEGDAESPALDGAAGVLRAWARHCFDAGDRTAAATAAQLEAWASHLLVLSPPPGRGPDDAPVTQRDWRGLVAAVEEQRKAERAFVMTTAACVRETVLGIVESFRATAVASGTCDQRIRSELERLQQASANATSLDELRASAGQVVSVIHGALEEQRRVGTEESRALRGKLAAIEAQLEEASAVATIDPLTQVGNRRRFDAFVARAMLFGGPSSSMSLVMIDIDHFKSINDGYGHPAGDEVLKQVANTLVRSFPRRSDAVVRLGGEEFAVVLTETKRADAARLARRFLDSIRDLTVEHQGRSITLTVSAGVAELLPNESVDELVGRADAALYTAKRTGRDRLVEAPSEVARAA